jgi:hypothetical protein
MWLWFFFAGAVEDASRDGECHSNAMLQRGHSDFKLYMFLI